MITKDNFSFYANYIFYLLLGLIREESGSATRIWHNLGAEREKVRSALKRIRENQGRA